MACLGITNGTVIRIIPENTPYSAEWRFTGKIYRECSPESLDNVRDIFTSEGLMVGNLIKKVTSAIGIKQCLACKGRQQAYNQRGLAIQHKIRNLI